MKLAIIYSLDINNTTHINIWIELKALLGERGIMFDAYTLKKRNNGRQKDKKEKEGEKRERGRRERKKERRKEKNEIFKNQEKYQ